MLFYNNFLGVRLVPLSYTSFRFGIERLNSLLNTKFKLCDGYVTGMFLLELGYLLVDGNPK